MTAAPAGKSAPNSEQYFASGIPAKVYLFACLFTFVFTLGHIISLPVEITYDGLGYIDMADVLGTTRFPHDWNPTRTPLFPLALKAGFWVLGRQPLALIAVSSGVAFVGILALGSALRRIAGDLTAAGAMVLISVFPTLVAYEHSVLTEAGSFCLLALICRIAFSDAKNQRGLWLRTAVLCAIFSLGYYWRQNILSVTPVVAGVLAFEEWMRVREHERADLLRVLARAALIVFVPYVMSWPWDSYIDAPGLRNVTLHQGMIRQALLPPEDPYVGENASMYANAIEESARNGNFYSGVTWDRLARVSGPIFAKPIPQGTPRFFLDLIRRYPMRYVRAFGRTTLLFAGVQGVESDNRSFREEVLSPSLNGSKISDGEQPLQAKVKQEFQQKTTPSALLWLLRVLSPVYDRILVLASLVTVIGVGVAIWSRNWRLFLFCGLPLAYLLSYAVLLVAIDRFMAPIYPLMLANLLLIPASIWNHVHSTSRTSRR